MSSAGLLLASAALVLLAGGLLLWNWLAQRRRAALTAELLDARIDARRLAVAGADEAPAAAPSRPRRDAHGPLLRLQWLLQRAGLPPDARGLAVLLGPALLLAGLAAWRATPPLAALAGLVGAGMSALMLNVRAQRRRDALAHALPGFIDTLVRLLAVGHSIASAFLAALGAAQSPLRDCLDGAAVRLRAGMDLDDALEQVARQQGAQPLLLFAAVVRMSTRYGGRVDQVLERMAEFMRDREEAQRELIAMSAETRMSAWVLGLLPASMALFILFINTAYLATMWADPGGRRLLLLAFGLQLLGGFLLYRLARLR